MMDPASIDLEAHLNLDDPEMSVLYADALQALANEVPPGTDVDRYMRFLLRNSRLLTIRAGAVQRLVDALTLRASGAYVQAIRAEVQEPELLAGMDAAALRRDSPTVVVDRIRATRSTRRSQAAGNESTDGDGTPTIEGTGQQGSG